MQKFELYHGDALAVLRLLPDESFDSIFSDPPYELGFMGRSWDSSGIAYRVELWRECLRVLKPGGYMLAFGGTRTFHRMACAIEDAGFEIRDRLRYEQAIETKYDAFVASLADEQVAQLGELLNDAQGLGTELAWQYGTGFPKSLDVSKALDKAAGAQRTVVGFDEKAAKRTPAIRTNSYGDYKGQTGDITAPATDAAQQWQGWGTALKPAYEPILVARKPLDGTVAANVLKHGVGGLNIDGCRVEIVGDRRSPAGADGNVHRTTGGVFGEHKPSGEFDVTAGRWPANVILDGSDAVLAQYPTTQNGGGNAKSPDVFGMFGKRTPPAGGTKFAGDSGSAGRFFYSAKASQTDRNEGCAGLYWRRDASTPFGFVLIDRAQYDELPDAERAQGNVHTTVKPTSVCRWGVRLITPVGGRCLDPFTGSGSTGKACALEGIYFVGIDINDEPLRIAEARITDALAGAPLFE
jgi:hypothetical protein